MSFKNAPIWRSASVRISPARFTVDARGPRGSGGRALTDAGQIVPESVQRRLALRTGRFRTELACLRIDTREAQGARDGCRDGRHHIAEAARRWWGGLGLLGLKFRFWDFFKPAILGDEKSGHGSAG